MRLRASVPNSVPQPPQKRGWRCLWPDVQNSVLELNRLALISTPSGVNPHHRALDLGIKLAAVRERNALASAAESGVSSSVAGPMDEGPLIREWSLFRVSPAYPATLGYAFGHLYLICPLVQLDGVFHGPMVAVPWPPIP